MLTWLNLQGINILYVFIFPAYTPKQSTHKSFNESTLNKKVKKKTDINSKAAVDVKRGEKLKKKKDTFFIRLPEITLGLFLSNVQPPSPQEEKSQSPRSSELAMAIARTVSFTSQALGRKATGEKAAARHWFPFSNSH